MKSGRVKGLVSSVRFTQDDIEKFTTAQRLMDNVEPSTWNKVFRRALTNYCNFLNKTPDELIQDRKKTLRSEDEEIRRTHEEYYTKFWKWLKQQHSQQNKRKKLAPNTISPALTAIRSFYDNNYYPLIKVKSPDVYNVRALHVPTPEELGLLVEKAPEAEYKALILAEAQSGISIGDLLSIRWDTMSAVYGTIKKQIFNGNELGIVHIHFVRAKSNVSFDTFFGHATVEILKSPEMPKDAKTVFISSARQFERVIKDAAEDAKIEGIVTPHCVVPETVVIANEIPISVQEVRMFKPVLTHRGDFQKVTDTMIRYFEGELVSILPYYTNIPVRISKEHEVLAIQASRCRRCSSHGVWKEHFVKHPIEWVPAGQLRAGDLVVYPRFRRVEPYSIDVFETLSRISNVVIEEGKVRPNRGQQKPIPALLPITPALCRLFGYYLAEGSLDHRGNSGIVFSFGRGEDKYAQEVLDLTQTIFQVVGAVKVETLGVGGKDNTLTVRVSSALLGRLFRALFNSGAKNKALPSWFLALPPEHQWNFIDTYFKGDGLQRTRESWSDIFEAATVSRGMAAQIRLILNRLGIVVSLCRDDPRERKPNGKIISREVLYRLTISSPQAKVFAMRAGYDIINDSVVRFAGAREAIVTEDYVFVKVQKTYTEHYQGTLYNFSVHGDESYTAEGIAVHNCLRKFFSTRLKITRLNDPAWNDTLIEYWQGHSLGRVRGTYFIPPPDEQARLYLQAEPRLSPVFAQS